jgi:hypothetical protein
MEASNRLAVLSRAPRSAVPRIPESFFSLAFFRIASMPKRKAPDRKTIESHIRKRQQRKHIPVAKTRYIGEAGTKQSDVLLKEAHL